MKHVEGGALSAEEAARLRQDKLARLEYVYSLADDDADGGLTLTEFLAAVRRARGTTLAKDLRLQLQMYSMIEKSPGACVSAEGAGGGRGHNGQSAHTPVPSATQYTTRTTYGA